MGGAAGKPLAGAEAGASGRAPLWAYLALFLGAWLPYLRTAAFDLTGLDDVELLVNGRYFLLDWAQAPKAFLSTPFYMMKGLESFYRPLLTLTFILDTHLYGEHFALFHLTNIFLHASACLALFWMLCRMGFDWRPCLGAAALHALHPVMVQAVAWFPGRNDSLLGLLAFLSMGAFALWTRSRGFGVWVLHLAALLAALFAKESAILVPILCLGWWFLSGQGWARSLIPSLFAWGILGGLWLALRWWALAEVAPGGLSNVVDLASGNLASFFELLGKAVFPLWLCPIPAAADAGWAFGLAVLGGLGLFFCGADRRARSRMIWGAGCFAATLAPILLLRSGFSLEHRLYLPLAGLWVFFLARGERLFLGSRAVQGMTLFLALAFLLRGQIHLGNFRNGESFHRAALAGSPRSPVAHMGLGVILQRGGRLDEAERCYRRAIELDPALPVARNNLAVLYLSQRRPEEAEVHLRGELAINPNYDRAHFNLGLVLGAQGRDQEAIAALKRAIEINPENGEAYEVLGRALAATGDPDQAERYRAEYLRRKRGMGEAGGFRPLH